MWMLLPFLACSGDPESPDDPDPTESAETAATGDTGCDGTSAWCDVDTQARFDAWVASLEQQFDDQGIAGFQVAVALDGQLVHSASWGGRDARTEEPITDATRFSFASVSKLFAAATLYDLQEDGVLDLDAPVTDYAPGFALAPGYDPSRLTPRMGLNHSSGMPDYWGLSCAYDTHDELWVDYAFPLLTPPGAGFNYSNMGYSMAAHAAEGAAGLRFEQLVDDRITQPLGLSLTYDVAEVMAGDYAHGHMASNADAVHQVSVDGWGCSMMLAGGRLWGTASDIVTFVSAQAAGNGPLEAASFAEMQGGQGDYSCGTGTHSYGAGLWTYPDPVSGMTFVEHSGYFVGFLSYVLHVPEVDLTLAVLVNDAAPVYADDFGWEGFYTLIDLEPPQTTWEPEPPAELSYAGTWIRVDANAVPIPGVPWWLTGPNWANATLTVQGEDLLASSSGLDLGPLTHLNGNCFYATLPDASVIPFEFWPDGAGGFDRIVSRNSGSGVREADVATGSMARTASLPDLPPGVEQPAWRPPRRLLPQL